MTWDWFAALTVRDGIGFDDLVAWAAGVVTVTSAVLYFLRPVLRQGKWFAQFREDWEGSPARPGSDAVPGVMERLKRLDGELSKNSGKSVRDIVHSTRAEVVELSVVVNGTRDELEAVRQSVASLERAVVRLIEERK